MNIRTRDLFAWGFTLIELLAMILIVLLMIFALIPGIKKAQRLKIREACRDNLKMVGLGYRTWSSDSSDGYPQHFEVARGGSRELLASGKLYLHFQSMSNELGSPKILVCPGDKDRLLSASFATGGNSNISYFASLDAKDTSPQMFLSGDRNFAFNGKAIGSSSLLLKTNAPMPLSWTKSIHNGCGNIGLADGSVQTYQNQDLIMAVQGQGEATNRLVFP